MSKTLNTSLKLLGFLALLSIGNMALGECSKDSVDTNRVKCQPTDDDKEIEHLRAVTAASIVKCPSSFERFHVDYAFIYSLDDPNKQTLCLTQQGAANFTSFKGCINLVRPVGDKSSPGTYCSDGHFDFNPISKKYILSEQNTIKADRTMTSAAFNGTKCSLVCLPPTLTFAGTGKSCANICK